MTLVKWTPQRNMINWFDDLGSIMNHEFHSPLWDTESYFSYKPMMDVLETENENLVTIDLPGIEKKDVEINVSEGILTVSGERKPSDNVYDKNLLWKERNYGTFKRSFTLSGDIKEDKIKAKFKNGVLSITIPKAEELKPVIRNIAIS